jgi:hypothetical protein
MKNIALIALTGLSLASPFARSAPNFSGYQGSISNNTPYVLTCSGMQGGYCANNPMPANGFIQMMPDPGSSQITGTMTLFDPNHPSQEVGTIAMQYSKTRSGWIFKTSLPSQYAQIQTLLPDSLLLSTNNHIPEKRIIRLAHGLSDAKFQQQGPYTFECTQMIGGYCSVNPLSGNKTMSFLPDPGANSIRGHLMVFDPHKNGHYVDNILFSLAKKNNKWTMTLYDLYGKIDLNTIQI